jgi:Ser/Thr protein kinase RdoA (MazF antagonist)
MPRVVEAYPALLARLAAAPATIIHGDYRLDNLFFDAAGAVAVIDWQFVSRCRGIYDVAYFIGLDLEPAARRAHEQALLAQYVATLAAHGVAGYSLETARVDYRRALLLAFAVFLIGAAGEQPNARMARVHEVGIARLAAAIAETDAIATVDAP